MEFFANFNNKGAFEKSLNASFITLIPEVVGADDIKSFRPISLVRSVYKILAKVPASRLRKVVGKVIGPSQHAFVPSHQILDAALIANECMILILDLEFPVSYASLTLRKLMIMSLGVSSWLFLRKWAFLTGGGNVSLFVFPLYDSLS